MPRPSSSRLGGASTHLALGRLRSIRRQLQVAFCVAVVSLSWLWARNQPSASQLLRPSPGSAAIIGASMADVPGPPTATAGPSSAASAGADPRDVPGAGASSSVSNGTGAGDGAGSTGIATAGGNASEGSTIPGSSDSGGAGVHDTAAGTAVLASATPFPSQGDTIHVLITTNGKAYVNWQTLVLYGTFLRTQRMPGGDKMVAFTRILHRVADDALVPGVPTWRVAPQRPECGGADNNKTCGYAINERPSAVKAFMHAAKHDPSLIRAPWLYLIESDYVLIRPIQAPGPAESAVPSLAFKFNYVSPAAKGLQAIMLRLFPPELGPLTSVPKTGPAPVLARPAEWARVVESWERLTLQIEADPQAVAKLGWVREMYGFALAAAAERIPLNVTESVTGPLIVQLPADDRLGRSHAFHYTWGPRFFWIANKTLVWRFEKRDYVGDRVEQQLPKPPLPPPWQEGVWTKAWERNPKGGPMTRIMYDSMVEMVSAIRAGIDEVGGPRWKEVLGRAAEQRRQGQAGQGAAAGADGERAGAAGGAFGKLDAAEEVRLAGLVAGDGSAGAGGAEAAQMGGAATGAAEADVLAATKA